MTCETCGRHPRWHGSEIAEPGTHLNESGCHDGVFMDDDEYGEGWQPDVIYRPCPHSSLCCPACKGSGRIGSRGRDLGRDCRPCLGTGWVGGEPHWPIPAEPETEPEHDRA